MIPLLCLIDEIMCMYRFGIRELEVLRVGREVWGVVQI
jgi:hypothetical protein